MSCRFSRSGQTLSLLVIVAGLLLVGCDSLHQGVRRPAREEASAGEVAAPGNEVLDVQPQSKKPFFKASRLPGGMSDEGREIERDLGIH